MAAPYHDFDREAWAALRAATPLSLTEPDLAELQGLNEQVSMAEVEAIYLPVSRLLNLQVAATQTLAKATELFLGRLPGSRPYVIGVAGSVAVGKSTFARILRALLARWPDHPRVDLVTTDGFLQPNADLEARGLLDRKGFPESYRRRDLVEFVADVKSGREAVRAPVYSHQAYDIVTGEFQVVDRPDIVIVEGLNVLQTGDGERVFVSDFFDFSIYIDADEADIEAWYVERFLKLRETVFRDPRAYFHRYAALSDVEARATACRIWAEINGVNLRENISPTKGRARLILEKGPDHAVRRVRLRAN
ncbi:MAG TPA: type I pantothenate kinase [Vicinamibacterales bacterium]|nr:type I pantothenate kinase [Vicinamibacterales bacterium]